MFSSVFTQLFALQNQVTKDDKNPWRKILTSVPVWALTAAFFANAWGDEMLFTFLPNFLNDILGFNVSQVSYGIFVIFNIY